MVIELELKDNSLNPSSKLDALNHLEFLKSLTSWKQSEIGLLERRKNITWPLWRLCLQSLISLYSTLPVLKYKNQCPFSETFMCAIITKEDTVPPTCCVPHLITGSELTAWEPPVLMVTGVFNSLFRGQGPVSFTLDNPPITHFVVYHPTDS